MILFPGANNIEAAGLCEICGGKFVSQDQVLYHARLKAYYHASHDLVINPVKGEIVAFHAVFGFQAP